MPLSIIEQMIEAAGNLEQDALLRRIFEVDKEEPSPTPWGSIFWSMNEESGDTTWYFRDAEGDVVGSALTKTNAELIVKAVNKLSI